MSLFHLFRKKDKELKASKPAVQTNPSDQKFSSDVERQMYENNEFGYRDMKDELDRQNRLLSRYWAAVSKYKEDNNLNVLIAECEDLFIKEDPPCRTSQCTKLVNYYMKAGLNDKAWGYLNLLHSTGRLDTESVRYDQARILRKEKKYADAIEKFMVSYLMKSKRIGEFQKEKFLKDISSCANRLHLTDDHREYLAYLIENQIKQKHFSERELVRLYRKFYEDEIKGM